MYTITEESEVF